MGKEGRDIDGKSGRVESSESVDVSVNVMTIIRGDIYNTVATTQAGHVRVFQYNTLNEDCVQLGADLDCNAEYNKLGTYV